LFYKGDITLLQDLNRNVAVIGLIDPTEEIEKRAVEVVKRLIKKELIIISGLAKGCDAIAHKVCVETDNKTIAILPTQINKISPVVNRNLAKKIVDKGGLLITEYYKESATRYEGIGRYIERDRLQAMFSKAIILIASYRKGEGDSGSRHAMRAAQKYEIEQYIMYNEDLDKNKIQFGLNEDLVNHPQKTKVKILLTNSIAQIKKIQNPNLSIMTNKMTDDQLTLL
jgi:DNA processing protein